MVDVPAGTSPQSAVNSAVILNPLGLLRNLWTRRELIYQLTLRDVAQRYRGSFLGVIWSFITPLLLLAAYTFVFSVVLKAHWGSGTESLGEFALTLFTGLIAFNLFSEVATRAPTLILASPNYVKKVVVPLEIFPVVLVLSALINSLMALTVLLLACRLLLGSVSSTLYLLPLAYLPLVLLALSTAWVFASLGVYIRDIGHGVGVAVQLLIFFSPVFYPVTAVPEFWRPFLYVNPMTTILSGFRRVILWQTSLPWAAWAGWVAILIVTAWLAYVWFMKTKKGFADVM
jgi:lipopolysaccharide transport system permease protein